MNKRIKICLLAICLFITLCGCDNKEIRNSEEVALNNDNSIIEVNNNTNSNNNEVALTITASSDFNKLAMSLEQLYNDSDIVCEIIVKEVNPYIDDMGRIISEVTPDLIHIYKGNYNGEKFNIIGGRMPYDEYYNNEIIKKKFEGHEDPNLRASDYSKKDVIYILDDGYVYSNGDEFIFFGKKIENENKFINTYAYQGSFKIDNTIIANKALKNDEYLYKDIANMNNSKADVRRSSQIEDSTQFSKELFINSLNEFGKSNFEN